MKKEIWQEDQPVLRADLVLAQSSKEDSITARQADTFKYGIVRDSQLLAELIPFEITVNVTPYSADIGTGVAYDPAGERIIIDSAVPYDALLPTTLTDNGIGGTTLTPQSTGSVTVPLTASLVNYIYISYLQTTDPTVFTLQDGTNSRLFTKGDDGYLVQVVTDAGPTVGDPETFKPNANAVFLGVVDIAQVLTLTERHTYNLKQNNLLATVPDALNTLDALSQPYATNQEVSHDEHVRAVGTGQVTPVNPHGLAIADLTGSFAGKTSELHEKLFHESGISGDDASLTSGLYGFAVDSAGAPIAPTFARDNFIIKKLLATEAVQINGITVSSSDLTEDFLFYFVDAVGNFLDNGTYTIYLDSLTKTLKLAANGSPSNTAYRVYGVTSGVFTNLNTVSLASVVSTGTNFLLWEVVWDSSGSGLGNDNFTSVVDKRFFGTIGSESLRRDSETDTVTIDHNIFVTGNNNIVPAGVIQAFAGRKVNMPPFHLYCDGMLYDRFLYPDLFAAIEYDWGGDGIQFFRVPDGRGGFLRGVQDISAVTFTIDNTTDIITTSAPHEFNHSGVPVKLTTTGTFPPEITADATYGYPVQRLYGPVYWVIWLSATTLRLAASHSDAIAGIFINFSTNGTGVHTVHPWLDPDALTREASAEGGATGNNSGTLQDHALQDHSHADFYKINNFADSSNSGGATPGSDVVRYDENVQDVQEPRSNHAYETRPRNIGVNFIIKY